MTSEQGDQTAVHTDEDCVDGTADQTAGGPPKPTEGGVSVEKITPAMQAEIDLLFHHKATSTKSDRAEIRDPAIIELAEQSLGEWLARHDHACEPYMEQLSFEALRQHHSRLISLLRSMQRTFNGSSSKYTTDADDPDLEQLIIKYAHHKIQDQPRPHPLYIPLRVYANARGFGQPSFESMLRDILTVVPKK